MRGYETCLVIHPETGEENIAALLNKLSELIANYHGKILKTENWGQKRLQYKIKNHQKGYYCVLYYLGNNQILNEMNRVVRFNESILRFQTLKIKDPSSIKKDEQPIDSMEITQTEIPPDQAVDLQST